MKLAETLLLLGLLAVLIPFGFWRHFLLKEMKELREENANMKRWREHDEKKVRQLKAELTEYHKREQEAKKPVLLWSTNGNSWKATADDRVCAVITPIGHSGWEGWIIEWKVACIYESVTFNKIEAAKDYVEHNLATSGYVKLQKGNHVKGHNPLPGELS